MFTPIRPLPLRNFYPVYYKLFEIAATPLLPFLYEIPVPSDAGGDFYFTTTLDDIKLRFRMKYNRRLGRWSMTIYDEAGDMIIAGKTLVNGLDLIGQYNDARLPTGKLVAASRDDTDQTDAGQFDLGDRIRLYYYTRK